MTGSAFLLTMKNTTALLVALALAGCEFSKEQTRRDALEAFNSRSHKIVDAVNAGAISEETAQDKAHIAVSVLRSTYAANGLLGARLEPYPMGRCKECGKFGFVDWKGCEFCEFCMADWSDAKYWAYAKKQGAAW